MINMTPLSSHFRATRSGGPSPNIIQRFEGALVAVFAMTATISVEPDLWWFPLAVFLLFDLSTLGYVRSPAVGAFWYNAIHTYTWPAILGVIALATNSSLPSLSTWISLVALAWAFHVGVDRMLGYGLKLPDAFTSTHLGRIGKGRLSTGSD